MSHFLQKIAATLSVSMLGLGMAYAQTGSTTPPTPNNGSATGSMQGNTTTERPGAGTPGSEQQPPQVGADTGAGTGTGTGAGTGNRATNRQAVPQGDSSQNPRSATPADRPYPSQNGAGRPARGDRE